MAYSVSLQQFEGPLDLLIHLIEKAEVDIMDIFVSEITAQYIEFINGMENLDMDIASEFLTMAARLLYIKSRSLLPKPPKEVDEEEEDPELALIKQLQEYKAFKEAASAMTALSEEASHIRTKLPEELILPSQETVFTGGTASELFNAFKSILNRNKENEGRVGEQAPQIRRDLYTVRKCMQNIRVALSEKDDVLFGELFTSATERLEIIVTFMALLELIMRGEAGVVQNERFGDIHIVKNELNVNASDEYTDEDIEIY